MNRETKKQLTSVDISGYSFEINQFEQRLNLRNLSASTFKNYILLYVTGADCILSH